MSEPDVQTQKINPLLEAIRIPGETFRLPSGGLFYKNGELSEDVSNGEVHVHPMTTRHELIMKTPDRLFSGKAVHDVFKDCVPEVLKPGELLAKDVDYLMMCLRAVSYGDNIEMTYTHDCENAKEHSYLLNVRKIIQSARPVDPTSLSNTFTMSLENGQVLTLKPPTFDSVIALYQALDSSILQEEGADEEVAKRLIENLVNMIVKVNDVEDKEMILEWLQQLKAGWVNQISDRVHENSNWGIETTAEVECKDCGAQTNIEVPTNPITFFT